jgi:hypothetical protein
MMSQLSMELDTEELTCSSVARRVNLSQLLAGVEALTMSVGSGMNMSALRAKRHPDGSWRRTQQGSFPMMEVELSPEWSMDWPKWATVWDGECGELTMSVHATSEPECLSSDTLPTPRHGKTTSENLETWEKRRDAGKVATMPLALAVRMLPTPNAFDSKGIWNRNEGTAHRQKGGCRYLSEVLATPAAADAQGSHGGGQGKSLRTDMHHYKAETGAVGALNPSFVDVMMGFPEGWTALTESEP